MYDPDSGERIPRPRPPMPGDGPWDTAPYDPYEPPGTPPPDQAECPPGYGRNVITGACIELFPGDDDPNSNGCGSGQHWDEAQKRCVAGPAPGGSGSGSGSGGTGAYRPPTYTPTKSPYDAPLSKQLFETLTDMINGGNAPFGPDTIAKLQAAALQSNKGQLANSQRDLQRRLVSSGLSRSGIAPSSYQRLSSAADADLSNNFRTVAVTAVQKNFEAKQTALAQAQQFLQSERANALSQDQMILAYARLRQESANLQATFDQQWKIVQNGNEQDLMKLMICLRTGVC